MMENWMDFARAEDAHYEALFNEYMRECEEYEEETEKEYAVTYSYKGSKYEWDYYSTAEDEEDAEINFWDAVHRGCIKKGIPENIDDIEILEVREVA